MTNGKTNQQYSFWAYKNNEIILKKLKDKTKYTTSSLINYLIAKGSPEVLKELKEKNSTLYRLSLINKRRSEREFVKAIAIEEKSKYYFITRFIKDWRKLLGMPFLNPKHKKKHLLKILDSYIKESQTYSNNQSITIMLNKYKKSFEVSKLSFIEIKSMFEVEIEKTHKLSNDKIRQKVKIEK